jgi:hypothetical protein
MSTPLQQKTKGLELTKAEQADLEKRIQAYSGNKSRWMGKSGTFLTRTGQQKAVDWKRFVFGPFEYFMRNLFAKPLEGALQALFSVVQKLLLTTCNTDGDSPATDKILKRKVSNLQTEVALALSWVERDLPKSMLPYIVHILVHIPKQIYRWNHVRNYWAFFSER